MESTWPTDWMRAGLGMCVLAVLAQEQAHGYAISQRLAAAGIGSVKGGTLYPLLARLETEAQVTASWQDGHAGPGRKVFAITDAGREALREQQDKWVAFTGRTTALLDQATHPTKGGQP